MFPELKAQHIYLYLSLSVNRLDYINMKSIAAITILASSAAAFAPAPVSKVESSLNYAAELDNMIGVTPETGNKVVSLVFCFDNSMSTVSFGPLLYR